MHTIVPSETLPAIKPGSPSSSPQKQEKPFRPVGATAFFIALIVLCLAIWFGIYWLMLHRI